MILEWMILVFSNLSLFHITNCTSTWKICVGKGLFIILSNKYQADKGIGSPPLLDAASLLSSEENTKHIMKT
jgi:hypothetical protein